MKKLLIICFLFCFSIAGLSQKDTIEQHPNRARLESRELIKILKNEGALLIRLETQRYKIDALKRSGNIAAANKAQAKLDKKNRSIIKAFRDTFDFCPVYFFYSDQSKYVSRNQLDSLTFVNDSLEADPSISFSEQLFLTGEFSELQEIRTNIEDEIYYYRGPDGIELKKKGQGYTNQGFSALVICDKNFTQLKRPFPYYIKTNATIFFLKKPHVNSVNELNLAFHKFHGGNHSFLDRKK